nr:amino acid transporter [Microbacterium thalassium]
MLGLAFGAALFAGVITLISMGFFQQRGDAMNAIVVALVIAGVSFIAVLVIVSLLLLAVDPSKVAEPVDKPVLLPDEDDDADAAGDTKADGKA